MGIGHSSSGSLPLACYRRWLGWVEGRNMTRQKRGEDVHPALVFPLLTSFNLLKGCQKGLDVTLTGEFCEDARGLLEGV